MTGREERDEDGRYVVRFPDFPEAFLRSVKRLGPSRRIAVRFDQRHGGSHGTLYYGNRKTTVKDARKEIGGLLLRSANPG